MSERRIKKKNSFAKPSKVPPAVKPTYEVPGWAGKPPNGMHLDVTKDGKLIEKFIVDGKTHFFFGRQREYIDFVLDHTSCSRVHSVMVYHKNLDRMFLIDLGSTHGTFLGNVQLEAHRPMQLVVEDVFSFGASTRSWVLRQKPNVPAPISADTSLNMSVSSEVSNENDTSNLSLLGLPEAENELNDLTEFNTAHNRRISTLPMDEANIMNPLKLKRRKEPVSVIFSADPDEIINPEDVDPSVGRFRNLISTEIIIPNKKARKRSADDEIENEITDANIGKTQDFLTAELYPDMPSSNITISPITPKTVFPKISSAPDVEEPDELVKVPLPSTVQKLFTMVEETEKSTLAPAPSTKRKYVKEAWPGRRQKGQNLLSV